MLFFQEKMHTMRRLQLCQGRMVSAILRELMTHLRIPRWYGHRWSSWIILSLVLVILVNFLERVRSSVQYKGKISCWTLGIVWMYSRIVRGYTVIQTYANLYIFFGGLITVQYWWNPRRFVVVPASPMNAWWYVQWNVCWDKLATLPESHRNIWFQCKSNGFSARHTQY